MSLFIGGPFAYPVESIQRSRPALAVGLGVLFAIVYLLLRWRDRLPWRSPVGETMKLTLFVLFSRIYLEKLGVAEGVASAVGIIWLAVPVGLYFGGEAARQKSIGKFWDWLLTYAFGIRLVVIAVMLVATHFELGTHFDNSSVTRFDLVGRTFEVTAHSLHQYFTLIVIPQTLLWPAVTLILAVPFGYFAFRRNS